MKKAKEEKLKPKLFDKPWKMVDLLKSLKTTEQVRLQMRACPHQVEVITVGMDLWQYTKTYAFVTG